MEPVDRSICWFCRHIAYYQADAGYSEYTPGSDFSLSCNKGVWDLAVYDDTLEDFRRKLETAATCDKFEPRG